MRKDEIKSIAEAWMKFWQGDGLDNFNTIHAENFIDHSAGERSIDRDGFRQGIVDLYDAFPDFMACIDDIVIETESQKAAIRWSATGTHRGVIFGHAPTGRVINFAGIEIIKVSGGMVVERWGEWDGLGLKDQLAGPE